MSVSLEVASYDEGRACTKMCVGWREPSYKLSAMRSSRHIVCEEADQSRMKREGWMVFGMTFLLLKQYESEQQIMTVERRAGV